MVNLFKNAVANYVKDVMIDKLEEFKGHEAQIYVSSLCDTLFEADIYNGAYFCNNESAREWVDEHFFDLDEIFEMINEYTDEKYAFQTLKDIFYYPDRMIVNIMVEVGKCILSECETLENLSEKGEITLTDELIDKIINDLKSM